MCGFTSVSHKPTQCSTWKQKIKWNWSLETKCESLNKYDVIKSTINTSTIGIILASTRSHQNRLRDSLSYGAPVNASVHWRPYGDMIWDQMGSLVVIQVPCSYMTSQSDLLIRLAISCPNTHKRPDQHCAPWLTAVGGKVREVSRSDTLCRSWRDRKVCCDVVDEYVMCEQVNNSTWLQQGSCLFFLYLPPIKSTVNNSACCTV